jgi:putative hydrolase
MSAMEPPGFGNPNLFQALFQIFSDPERLQWDLAAELARQIASEGESPPNVDPVVRMRVEELYRVAEMRIATATSLDTTVGGRLVAPECVTASVWATTTLSDWRPLLTTITKSHARPLAFSDEGVPNETPPALAQVFGQAAQALGPAMVGMQLGSSIGYLARRAFGESDLPIPRPAPQRVLFVPHNMESFSQDWSLPFDEVCLWVCLREVAHHCILSIPHVSQRLNELLEEYARSFAPDPVSMDQRLASLDLSTVSTFEELQEAFGDPAEILSSMVTPHQRVVADEMAAIVGALEGWVDSVMDDVGNSLVASYGPLTEALRRRRIERDANERYVDVLFGIAMDQECFARGNAFVEGVVARAGRQALSKLWISKDHLPTPAEMEAPGLWLERISYISS